MPMQMLAENMKIKNHLKVIRKLPLIYHLMTKTKGLLWQKWK